MNLLISPHLPLAVGFPAHGTWKLYFCLKGHCLQWKMQLNIPSLEMEVLRQQQKIILLPSDRASH